MTPDDFLSWYSFDERMVTGEFFPPEPVVVEEGDHVGIVLLNMGGPDTLDAIKPFLYHLFMDPAIIDIPLPGFLRRWLCSFISWRRAEAKKEEYELIGGGSPLNELSHQQADLLEEEVNRRISDEADISCTTYLAMRYWKPYSEDAAEKMESDGVDKVLLLPLYPQYSKTTTGSSIAYWKALEENGEIPDWPTSFVHEYATHPSYIEAINGRIDEALETYPSGERDEVHLVFSAHGTPIKEMEERRDPYCCLVHSTVKRVMETRNHDLPFHTAFQSQVGPAEWLKPSTPDRLEELAENGVKSVLLIPVSFVSDHIETDFELDIEVREEAEEFGIEHFKVMEGINDHPSFIEALTEVSLGQMSVPPGTVQVPDDEQKGKAFPSQTELPRYEEEHRDIRCVQCDHVTEARCWDPDLAVQQMTDGS